jgi:hypothetical protein
MRRTTHLGDLVSVFLGWTIAAGAMMYFDRLTGDDAVIQVVSAVFGAFTLWLVGDRVRKSRSDEAA